MNACKKTLSILAFLLLITIADASDEDLIYSAESANTRLEMSSKITLESASESYSVAYATANMTFVPMQRENQKIISAAYDPQPYDISDNSVLFRWENPELGEYQYSIEADMTTTINRKQVKQKISFPIKNLAEQYIQYTQPTGNIDSNDPEIILTASQLAEGEDDMYITVNKLVSWIKENINYNLDTLTADVSQPASWAIKNKYGVCDEITSLFIAMARSIGIPARYISGMAYTNYADLNDWGPHAWAEVYYPNTGWVSYDITYDEFGYVDASHIALKESLDSNESSTNFGWRGRDVELKPDETKVTVKLLQKTGTAEPNIKISAKPLKDTTAFGSYDVVEADIENLQDYYLSEDISLARVKEMEITGSLDQQIVLKPGETKKIFWLVRISPDLDRKFIYTIPISVYSARNITGTSSIQSTARANTYTKEEMQAYIQEKTEEEQKTYSKDISMQCEAKEKYYLGDDIQVNCAIKNEGNVYIKDLSVCMGTECQKTDIGITKSAQISFQTEAKETGEKDIAIKAANHEISKTSYITLTVYDKPKIEITSLEYNKTLKFGEELELKFILDKTSLSNPLKTNIKIMQGKKSNEWGYGELKESQDFIINFNTKQMAKQNTIKIEISYEDEQGNKYKAEKEITVEVTAERLFDKIRLWINSILI